MMLNLAKLSECCQHLNSDKITERKKQIDTLHHLLNNADIVTAVNNNSDRRESLTWDRVFESVQACMLKEMEYLKMNSAKPTTSAATLSNREKKKQECANLIRLIVKKANEKEPRLKTVKLVNHLIAVMHDEFMWQCVSIEYSNLLLADVLGNHTVSRELPPSSFNDIICVYVAMYKTSNSNYELYMQILEKLIYIGSVQTTLDCKLLFRFFEEVIIKFWMKLSTGQQHILMKACTTFCNAVAQNCRLQICSLGEEILDTVTASLDKKLPKPFKGVLFSILQLQIICHHPNGATTEEDGMLAIDKLRWKKCVCYLYEVLMNELNQPLLKSRNTASKFIQLEPDHLDLLVDVCHLVYTMTDIPDSEEPSSSTKKRRTMPQFSIIIEKINHLGIETLDAIQWLQLLGLLLKKYPTVTPLNSAEEWQSLIQLLHQFVLDCKSYVIMSHLLACIRSVFLAFQKRIAGDLKHSSVDSLASVWTKIYEISLKTVSLNYCIPEGHALIQELIASKAVKPGSELKCLFSPGVSPVSQHALLTLATILKHVSLQCLNSQSRFCVVVSSEHSKCQDHDTEIRLQLLDWLLPNLQDERTCSVFKRSDPPSCNLMGEVLVGLVLQECRDILVPSKSCSTVLTHLQVVETSYLQSIFISMPPGSNNLKQNIDGVHSQLSTIIAIQDKLMELLLRDCGYLLDSTKSVEGTDVFVIVTQCCLVAKCLGCFVRYELLSVEGLAECRLCDVLQKLMKRLANLLHDVCNQETHSFKKMQTLTMIVLVLQQLYSWDGTEKFCKTVMQFCREMTSEKLINVLFDLLHGKILHGGSLSANQMNNALGNSVCDISEPSSSVAYLTDNGTPDVTELRQGTSMDGSSNLLTVPMNHVERLRHDVAQLLIAISQHSRSPLLSPLRPPAASRSTVGNNSTIQTRILEPFLQPTCRLDRPENVQLALTVIAKLLGPVQQINDRHLEMILDFLRKMCKCYFKDGEVSAECLNILSAIFLRLSASSQENREKAMHILNVFWDLKRKGKCGPLVELGIAKVIAALAKCKPHVYQRDAEDGSCGSSKLSPYDLAKFLESQNYSIASFAANHITILFNECRNSENSSLELVEAHQKVFNLVKKSIENSAVGLDGSLSSKDYQQNWTSAVLTALMNIAVADPFCLKEVVLHMCRHAKEIPLSLNIVKKVLKQVAVALNYPSLSSFYSMQMGYLAHHYLQHDLGELLWRLTDAESEKEFYKEYYSMIVPHIFHLLDDPAREALAKLLDRPWKNVVEECFPQIMAFVLPVFAVGDAVGDDGQRAAVTPVQKRMATTCHHLLEETLSAEVVDKLLTSCLNEVVVAVLKCLYVDGDVTAVLPPPNPPFFNSAVITGTLHYLMKACDDKNTSLIIVLSKIQDGLQSALLSLHISLESSHESHEVYRVMSMYALFVRLILKDFCTGLNGGWAFLLQEVLSVLAQQLTRFRCNAHYDSALLASGLMLNVIQGVIDACASELGKHLPLMVNCLIPYLKDGSNCKLTLQILSILKFLIFESGDNLSQALEQLEIFPEWPVFSEIRKKHLQLKYGCQGLTLKKEILFILDSAEIYEKKNRCEELQFLQGLLATNKNELSELVMELENAGFSNECKETVLYRLVVELVNICADATLDSQMVVAAAKCLGEIGPISLCTIVLQPSSRNNAYNNALSYFKGNSISQCFVMIFHKLHSYVMAPNVEVKKVASAVLKELLSTKSGHKFSDGYAAKKVGHLFKYLHPFHCKIKPTSQPVSPVTEEEFFNIVDVPSLWSPDETSYEKWIRELLCTLIDTRTSKCEIIQSVKPICEVKVEFCEELLPYLVHIILSGSNGETYRSALTRQMDNFFAKFCGQLEAASPASTPSFPNGAFQPGPIFCNRKAIAVLLNVVKFLRLQDRTKIRGTVFTSWDNNFWLDLNYLQLAEAANFCKAYLTSLFFLEIWYDMKVMRGSNRPRCESSNSKCSEKQSDSCSSFPNISQIMLLSSSFSEEGSCAQDLLLQAYRNIGDPDAIYGCGTTHLTNPSNRLHFYEHECHWEKALSAYDLALYSKAPISREGMLKAMYKIGLHHLSESYSENTMINDDDAEQVSALKEYQYQCAWKMSRWSLPTSTCEESSPGFHSSVYGLLHGLFRGDKKQFCRAADQAYRTVIQKLQIGSLESTESLYLSLAHLSSLNHLDDYLKIKIRNDDNSLAHVLEMWSKEDALFQQNYDLLEPILSLRCSVLQLLVDANQHDCLIRNALVACLEQQERLAKDHGLFQWANIYIRRLQQITGINSEKKFTWKIEEAKIFWADSERETAKSLLCTLIQEIEQNPILTHSKLHAQALGLYGDWLGESRSANALVVLENYLEKSISMIEKLHSSENDYFLMNTYLVAARYADAQYQRATNYVKSPEYQSKKEMIKRSHEAIAKLNANPKEMTKDKKKSLVMLERQVVIDNQEVVTIQQNKQKFLKQALKHYMNCLRIGDGHNNRIFRLISLWFDNLDNEDINLFIKEKITLIPSHKFLPLIYQLAARMSSKIHNSVFHSTLIEFIIALINDHPYHTLHVIFALSNASKDEQYLAPAKKTGKRPDKKEEEDRVLAARHVLGQVRTTDRLGPIILEMDKVCDAVIELSYWNPPPSKACNVSNKIPANQRICQLKNLEHIPPLTLSIRVDPTGKYENLPGIRLFQPEFKFCGGANAPKQIRCVATDGKEYIELVKGLDDLRQDAVMQQVFAMVNYLLNRNPETNNRKLHIRTYKVVPMSQRSGLLEWCTNTMPLSEYLVGVRSVSDGAHRRIYPSDYTVPKCRELLQKNAGKSADIKLEVFKDICDNLKPVFRHFFMECFRDPPTWFEKRTAYIKSVATTSIVGYILGLGDRHVSNILIDLQSGEFIHIDLGIAFDQSKLLPTPETVPFRLTRDVVDGMGIMGTEGIFRRCCEKTMEVMRDSQEVIVTILEVLLYDPLYFWTLSPLKACHLQNRGDYIDKSTIDASNSLMDPSDSLQLEDQNVTKGEDVNKQAERVLLRLQEKLQGKEEGTILSVHGQVTHLIQEAIDPSNLCRLFHGWQPYL